MRPLLISGIWLLLLAGCCKNTETASTGTLRIDFSHDQKGSLLILDTLLYTTSTGHNYKVTDLQYFISDVVLYREGGSSLALNAGDGIHYVDYRTPATLSWTLPDGIKPGAFDSLSFTFGISGPKNTSNRFPDPPERDMAWPDILGGGYHYMKMNMMYRDSSAFTTRPFMFHLGIGQIYSTPVPNPDSITGYVQNFFRVGLPVSFSVTGGVVSAIRCTMQVDRWFDGPETFDFADYPYGIMQYQEGMHRACLNGRQVFKGEPEK